MITNNLILLEILDYFAIYLKKESYFTNCVV